ncbi:hypothetical protein IM53_017500 [Xanthomonas phaseoli pv. dieffenbachiae]|uniref:Uncharacterized protein n=1 Tax=Xanthomonas phaseoli pv. dieffenbachiae TaxID=92828 RepID=A0A1V9GXX8_9XANT|nr:hypothetical protein IM53_017500 [Xanthomonas phaseoli pv. dieffenbachiae]
MLRRNKHAPMRPQAKLDADHDWQRVNPAWPGAARPGNRHGHPMRLGSGALTRASMKAITIAPQRF